MKKKFGEEEVLKEVEAAFNLNYERLRREGGHALTEDIRRLALQMVILYWKRMPEIAENITDTEVRLSLPEQNTPHGRPYSIEGIVDIIREQDQTWMYDVKTHDGEYVRRNLSDYEKQLNIYAHIWNELRGEQLDHTAVIALSLPRRLNDAVHNRDEAAINRELPHWDPMIEIPFKQQHVDQTIRDFGRIVDCIEENEFAPPTISHLKKDMGGESFVAKICGNCDARFSCESYRSFAVKSGAKSAAAFRKYMELVDSEAGADDWRTTNLEAANIPDLVDTSD